MGGSPRTPVYCYEAYRKMKKAVETMESLRAEQDFARGIIKVLDRKKGNLTMPVGGRNPKKSTSVNIQGMNTMASPL